MVMFVQQLVNGLCIGCIYGLIALGYSMVFGVLRMVNFAHSEFFMLGPMAAFIVLLRFGIIGVTQRSTTLATSLSPIQAVGAVGLGLLVAVLFCGALGFVTERITVRPLRQKASVILIVGSLGTQIFLRNFAMLFLGRDQRGFPRLLPTAFYEIKGVSFTSLQVVLVAITVVLMVGLVYFVNKTYLGRCIRSAAEDNEVAGLMGVNVNFIISLVFVLGPALGGVSGVLSSMYFEHIYYATGALFGIKAWTAAIIGGIGSIPGAMAGGLVVGLLETMGAGYLGILSGGRLGTEFKDLFAFAVMILMLLFRPQGIFGEAVKEN